MESEAFNGVSSSAEVDGLGEGGFRHSQHVAIARVQLRRPRSKLPCRPTSLPAERTHSRGQVDENNTRNSAHQGHIKARSCYQSIEEVDETENPKLRASAHYRSTFIDTQTLRRTWDKQYKHEVATKTVKVVASSSADSVEVDAGNPSAPVPLSSSFPFGNSEGVGNTIYPDRPFTVTVRPSRTLKREDNVSKFSLVTKALRAPRTLQPPPGTFYKPPSGSKSKGLQSSARGNSAEEEEEEEDEEELGIEIEVSVDEPVEEDAEAEQAAVSTSSSPEELGHNPVKPVYQRLRPRRLPEIEHREAHFV